MKARLVALTDVPRPESSDENFDFDISVFVGPLFYLWLVQLPLPWVRCLIFLFVNLVWCCLSLSYCT